MLSNLLSMYVSLESTFRSTTKNGEITLGSVEQKFKTGSVASEFYQITADQFDTNRWDNDSDGVSNIDELLAGTNPLGDDTVDGNTSTFNLADVSQDLIRALAGYPLDQLAVVVDDLAFVVGQTTTIVWPDNSWYQVQNASSYTTVCDGGAECQVVPGSYVVINQSTDVRSHLDVPYINPADQADAMPLLASSLTTEYADFKPLTIKIGRTRYNCENGGSMIRESGAESLFNFVSSPSSGRVQRDGYLFDQCRMTVRDGLLPDGSYLIQGNLQSELLWAYAGYTKNSQFNYDGFSIIGDEGLVYRIHAQTEHFSQNGSEHIQRRRTTITDYQKNMPDGKRRESITDGQFYREVRDNVGFYLWETLDTDGMLRNVQTANQRVTVTTDPALTRQLIQGHPSGNYSPIAYNGKIEMLAEDGSFLYVNANPFVDPEVAIWQAPPLLDLDYTTTSGQQIQMIGVEQKFLKEEAPNCYFDAFSRNKQTGRIECDDEGEFVVP